MKGFDQWDELFFIIGVLFIMLVFVVMGVWFMGVKTQMCRDFGQVVYHRELSWIECLTL